MGNSQTQGITDSDIVIFLVGPSNDEKRYFMQRLDLDFRAAKNVFVTVPTVYGIQSWVYSLGWMLDNVVFVAVPPFDEADAEGNMERWSRASGFLKLGIRSGVLYIHPTGRDPERLPNHIEKFARSCPKWFIPASIHVVPSVPLDTSSSVDDTRVGMLAAVVRNVNSRQWKATVSRRFVKGPDVAYEIVRDLAKEIKDTS